MGVGVRAPGISGCMLRALASVLVVLAVAAPAATAQDFAGQWASSPAGHLAFVPQDPLDEHTTLRLVGPDGQLAAPEEVAREARDPAVALGPRGDAVVTWTGADQRLWARYRPVGGTLGPPELVATKINTFIESSPVGVDANGTVTIAWVPDSRNFDGGIRIRTRTEAGVWSAPQTLPGLDVYRPQLAVTGDGAAVLTWSQNKSLRVLNARQLAVSTRPPGGTFSAPVVVAGVQRHAEVPIVAANDRGDAAVVWVELHGKSVLSIHGVFRAPGGRFGSPVALSRIKDVAGRRVAILPDGRMILGWTDHETNRLEARTRAADGTLGPPRVLTSKLELNSTISALALGDGAIAWREYRKGQTTVLLARADAAGRLGAPRVIARTKERTIGPAFAVSPFGLAMVLRPPERTGSAIRWTRIG